MHHVTRPSSLWMCCSLSIFWWPTYCCKLPGVLPGQRAAFARMLTGSVCAAVSALILFAPELSCPVQILYKLASALAIAALTFGWRDQLRLLAAACSCMLLLNILLAGLVVLIIFQTGATLLQTGNLAVYLRVSPLLLLGLSGLCCGAVGGCGAALFPPPTR